MKKLSINSKGSSVSEHDSTPSSSTEDIPGAVQESGQRSESPISFSLSRVRELSSSFLTHQVFTFIIHLYLKFNFGNPHFLISKIFCISVSY